MLSKRDILTNRITELIDDLNKSHEICKGIHKTEVGQTTCILLVEGSADILRAIKKLERIQDAQKTIGNADNKN